jgi:hypothetical protein
MRARLPTLLLLLADQGVCSLGNFSLLAVGAHLLSPHDFGRLGVCITVGLIALGCARAAGGEPLAIRWSGVPRTQFTVPASGALTAGLGVSVAAMGLSSLLLTIVWDDPGVAAACAVSVPCVILQDSTRYVLLADSRLRLVLFCDLLMLALQLGGFGFLAARRSLSPEVILLVWGGAGLLSALVAMTMTNYTVHPADLRRWVGAVRDLVPKLLMDFGIQSGLGQVALLAISALVGVVGFGYLRLAYLALGPVNILLLSMLTTGLPYAVRTGKQSADGLRRLAAVVSIVCGFGALAWTAMLLFVPAWLTTTVLGGQWAHARGLLLPIGLGYVATGLSAGPMLRLQASAALNRLVRTRLAVAIPALLLPTLAAALFGLRGAAWGIGVAAWLGTAQWLRASAGLSQAAAASADKDPAAAVVGGTT